MERTVSVIERFAQYITLNRGLSDGTAREYTKDLREVQTWMRREAKVERWSQIEKETIDDYVADMAANGMAPATISRRISCLRSFYQWAWVMGWQTENPAKYVSTPKIGSTVPKTLGTDEIAETLRDGSIDLETRAMIAVLAETGMRISELLGLRLLDIDTTNRRIVVRGKGNKERVVYYGDMTASVVSSARTVGNGRLFDLGDREARYRIHKALRAHTRAQKCSSHVIRHTWATAMLNNGASLPTIQALLGHKSVKTTERYAQVAGRTVATQYKQYSPSYYGRETEKEMVMG